MPELPPESRRNFLLLSDKNFLRRRKIRAYFTSLPFSVILHSPQNNITDGEKYTFYRTADVSIAPEPAAEQHPLAVFNFNRIAIDVFIDFSKKSATISLALRN